MHAVAVINRDILVQVMGIDRAVPLIYAEGMIGAIPVFETEKDAENYINDKNLKAEIFEVT